MNTFQINFSSQKTAKTDLSTGDTSIKKNVEVKKVGGSSVQLQISQFSGEFTELFEIKQIGANGKIRRTVNVFVNKAGNLIFENQY